MNTQLIIEKKNESTTETVKELTLPSKIIRAFEPEVIQTVLGHWDILRTTANSEEMFVQLFVELFDMDHGMNALPQWLADEVTTDTRVVAEAECICGPNGLDMDCQPCHSLIGDRVGMALSLSMH